MKTNVSLNLFNLVLIQGIAESVKEEPDGQIKFWLNWADGRLIIGVHGRTKTQIKSGDSVTVEGKLRYNADKNKFKIKADRITYGTGDLNLCLLEIYPKTDLKRVNDRVDFMAEHMTVNKQGELYNAPINCYMFGKTADISETMIHSMKLYLLVGEIRKDSETKNIILFVKYIKSQERINREIDYGG